MLLLILGQAEILKELLKVDEIDLNVRTNENETVLFRAVDNCNVQANISI